ncbi:DNA-damage-inducible protein f, putative [Ricinus communis]|uniref:Protein DETOXIFICATION n=1 Tax=Ricinus communis TaxID=3988 RepID=B9T1P5_RICCO|nr:DNA-damage-inducible protein f, putative [Ricinus communis]
MAENGALHLTERKWKIPLLVFFRDARLVFKMDELGLDILRIAVPAAMALAADPVASLIDTAFIGHLGAVEIAAVGVSIAIINQASKVTIFPLVYITTSFVAEEDTVQRISIESQNREGSEKDLPKNRNMKEVAPEDAMLENLEKDSISGDEDKPKNNKGRRHIPSASIALIVGGVLGLMQAIFLIFCAKPLLSIMGVKSGSPMLTPARKYLTLRALGSPAVLLSLAMQGVFRGFKDTKTPLYATVAGDLANIILDPIFIFTCRLGVSGAAIAHVLSQYLILFILLLRLMKSVDFLPPSPKDLQFGKFLKNGFLLLARIIAATIFKVLAASRGARLGSTPMAAFQICLQVWLTSSLLADGLTVAGQAIIACAFAEKDYQKATAAATRILQMSFVLGLGLAAVVGVGLHFGDGIFSKDPNVLDIISIGIPFVAATQHINSIALVFDGVNFGASDFAYSAYSMVLVAIASIVAIFVLSKTAGFVGIWIAITIFMGLRTLAGVWRMGTGTGPWNFLRGKLLP